MYFDFFPGGFSVTYKSKFSYCVLCADALVYIFALINTVYELYVFNACCSVSIDRTRSCACLCITCLLLKYSSSLVCIMC